MTAKEEDGKQRNPIHVYLPLVGFLDVLMTIYNLAFKTRPTKGRINVYGLLIMLLSV